MLNVVNSEAYFLPHWGLGDAIIVNGLLRVLAKNYARSYVICKPSNLESVQFMVRDFATAVGWKDEDTFAKVLPEAQGHHIIPIGYQFFPWAQYPGHPYEGRCFYDQFGMDFQLRWSNFHVERDPAREEAYFQRLNIHEDYIFVHTDPKGKFNLDRSRLPTGIRVIEAGEVPTANIFDYLLVLELAKEIHIIESAFEHLIDSFTHWTNRLVAHRYARSFEWVEYAYHTPELRLNWEVLS
jgi:hypothetical protein